MLKNSLELVISKWIVLIKKDPSIQERRCCNSIVNGEHLLLGRLILDKKLPKKEASKHVGRPFAASIKFETYWVSEKPWLPIQTK